MGACYERKDCSYHERQQQMQIVSVSYTCELYGHSFIRFNEN